MSVQKAKNPTFSVSTQVNYIESESKPDSNFFLFSYRITITNHGSDQAQLMSRHWIITDALFHVEEVRGAGVVGLQPKIMPGQHFQYDSACPLGTPSGSMKGTYEMVWADGEVFSIEIPEFYLIAPTALH